MNQNDLSDEKRFALEVLLEFDELAKPEIKNRVMSGIWNYVLRYVHKIILRKSDKELNAKLFRIYKKLHPKFQQVDMSIELQKAEQFSGIKVPNVGDLARQRNTVKLTTKEIDDLIKEAGF